MKIQSTITINADVSTVFDVFTDLTKTTEYISGITGLEVLEGPARLTVGTKWKETRKIFGKEATETMWVTAIAKNKSYTVEAQSNGTKYISVFTFEAVDGRTHVTWVFEGIALSFAAKLMSCMGFLFAGSMKKMLAKDLEDLKLACEGMTQ